MQLHTIWFVIIAIFWVGFFVLEGFDFGVGALHMLIGKTETERRVVINTIGPWWDGNEVWLIVAGASMFAAFPGWYATMFSALYLALVLVLVALFARGVSFEYRGKRESPRWRDGWTPGLTDRERPDPAADWRRARRPPARAPDQLAPRLHRQLLRPAHRLRTHDRREHARVVPAARRDVPGPADHRRDPRSGPRRRSEPRGGRRSSSTSRGASGRWS